MSKKQSLNLNDLDETIAKLERIKQLLEDINRLAKQYECPNFDIPFVPQPQPMPYVPGPSTSPITDPPWYHNHIWCKADTDGDTGKEKTWL